MWDLVTAVDRIDAWSPEVTGSGWCDGASVRAVGPRFRGRTRFPNVTISTVTCVVHHAFSHGPGLTGARVHAEIDPGALNQRLITLCRNMATTVADMVTIEIVTGATR